MLPGPTRPRHTTEGRMATTQRADDYYAWSSLLAASASSHRGPGSLSQHTFARLRAHFGTHAEANPASLEAQL